MINEKHNRALVSYQIAKSYGIKVKVELGALDTFSINIDNIEKALIKLILQCLPDETFWVSRAQVTPLRYLAQEKPFVIEIVKKK